MKLVFFGDGAWAANSLARLRQDGHEILAVVVRRRPSSGEPAETARSLGLPTLQPADANSPEFVARLRDFAPELNLSVSYDQIIRRPLLEAAPRGFVNFHAGKLPNYRGRNVVNWALINGETEIGLTAHFMDEGIDTGDILLQRTLPIGWTRHLWRRPVARRRRVPGSRRRHSLPSSSGRRSPAGRKPTSPAPTSPGVGRGTSGWTGPTRAGTSTTRSVRISRPGPGARTTLGGKTVIVWRAFWDPSWPSYLATPGQVVGRKKGEGVVVKTGDSTLLVTEIEESAGRRRPAGLADRHASGSPDWRRLSKHCGRTSTLSSGGPKVGGNT